MCTLLLYPGAGIGFSRDESVKRKIASPPSFAKLGNGVMGLFPVDGDFGGTWIGANSAGRIYALMNFYEKEKSIPRQISRGILVREMILGNLTEPIDVSRFQPFKMAVMDREYAFFYKWDGDRILREEIGRDWFVAGSSGLLGEAADIGRKQLFIEKFKSNHEWNQLDFHSKIVSYLSSHEPSKGAMSPCMHREDANTVSMSILKFQNDRIDFYYKEGNPCMNGAEFSQNIVIF